MSDAKTKAPSQPIEQQVFINLARSYDHLHHDFAALFKRYSISEQQFNVLRILRGAHPDGLPCQQIADRMITRVPDITRLLDRLEARGLVERSRSTEDRRVIYVAVKQKGLELLEKLDEPVIQLHSEQLQHMSKKELFELNRLLERMRAE